MTTEASAERSLLARLAAPPETPGLRLLARVREFFVARGETLYLVGGAVRDAARASGREPLDPQDLDFTTEGDGLALALELAAELGAAATRHEAFLNAELLCEDGLRIDLATTRREIYAGVAALPETSRGSLQEDLARRDFSVNAMAVKLAPRAEPELLDPFHGLADLAAGALRVLHGRSLYDDPTRLLRGVRFEERLGLALDAASERQARAAVADRVFDRLSADRLRAELRLVLEQPGDVAKRLDRLAELGVLAVVEPGLAVAEGWSKRLARFTEAHRWLGEQADDRPTVKAESLHWLVLLEGLRRAARRAAIARLGFRGAQAKRLAAAEDLLAGALGVLAAEELAPHRVDDLLAPLAGAELVALLAAAAAAGQPTAGRIRGWIGRWLREMRALELSVGGDDLLARGFLPGPALGEALRRTRQARLDGRLAATEELAFALDLLERDPRARRATEAAGGEGAS